MSRPSTITINSLPVALLHSIGEAATATTDKASLTLVSKLFNRTLTPALYAHICLERPQSISQCLEVLASSAPVTTCRHDLPSMVKSLHLLDPAESHYHSPEEFKFVDEEEERLWERLLGLLSRMPRLRHFSIRVGHRLSYNSASQQLLRRLTSASTPSITTLVLQLSLFSPFDKLPSASGHVTQLTGLRTLKLYVAVFPSFSNSAVPGMNASDTSHMTYMKLMNSLLVANASSLTSLALAIYAPLMEHLLQGIPAFPVLEVLECSLEHLSLPVFEDTSSVRTLTVIPSVNSTKIILPHFTFPNLNRLVCHPEDLNRILKEASTLRPIHTISLNYVTYERTPRPGASARCSYVCDITRANDGTAYSWPTLLPCLRWLQYKYLGHGLRHLSMLVRSLEVGPMRKVKSVFRRLESLCVVVEEQPDREVRADSPVPFPGCR